jgi:hypothetical protein
MVSGKQLTERAMNDTDRIVAAIFAAHRCANPAIKPEDLIREYQAFLDLLQHHAEEKDIAGYAAVAARALG